GFWCFPPPASSTAPGSWRGRVADLAGWFSAQRCASRPGHWPCTRLPRRTWKSRLELRNGRLYQALAFSNDRFSVECTEVSFGGDYLERITEQITDVELPKYLNRLGHTPRLDRIIHQPRLEQISDLRAFHATPYRVHHGQPRATAVLSNPYPIGDVYIARNVLNPYAELPYPKETLGEDHAPDFIFH